MKKIDEQLPIIPPDTEGELLGSIMEAATDALVNEVRADSKPRPHIPAHAFEAAAEPEDENIGQLSDSEADSEAGEPVESGQPETELITLDLEPTSLLARIHQGITGRRILAAAIGLTIAVPTAKIIKYEIDSHTTVPNHVKALPSNEVPDILKASPTEALTQVSSGVVVPTPSPSLSPEKKPTIPELAPHAPTRIQIPKLDIDTKILPVSSTPTGKKNSWGGDEYNEIDFPVDAGKQKARYWVQGGEPNTVTDATIETNAKAAERTIIYGHASDIGNHLLFQDLQKLKIGDKFTLTAGGQEFTYMVYYEANPAKGGSKGLVDDSAVYDLPKNGRKEVALVACLPDSASHSVRIGYLSSVKLVPKPAGHK